MSIKYRSIEQMEAATLREADGHVSLRLKHKPYVRNRSAWLRVQRAPEPATYTFNYFFEQTSTNSKEISRNEAVDLIAAEKLASD
jgi:hypothetical protein